MSVTATNPTITTSLNLGHAADHITDPAHIAFVEDIFASNSGFFMGVFPLPEDAPDAESGLYGPTAGDDPVEEGAVTYETRPNRAGASRLVARPPRPCRSLAIIGIGNSDLSEAVVFTAYGTQAPECTPREWWDQGMLAACGPLCTPQDTPRLQLEYLKAGLLDIDARLAGLVPTHQDAPTDLTRLAGQAESIELSKIRAAVIVAIESATFWVDHALSR